MTLGELHDVIDKNWDSDEILVLEFEGNDEFNRVRSDCLDLLKPILHYKINSLGITDNGEYLIWLDKPEREVADDLSSKR